MHFNLLFHHPVCTDIDESGFYFKGQNEITATKEGLISHEEMNHNAELVRSMKVVDDAKFVKFNLGDVFNDNAQIVFNHIGEKRKINKVAGEG